MKDTMENFSIGMVFLILAVVVVGVIAYRAALGNSQEELTDLDELTRRNQK